MPPPFVGAPPAWPPPAPLTAPLLAAHATSLLLAAATVGVRARAFWEDDDTWYGARIADARVALRAGASVPADACASASEQQAAKKWAPCVEVKLA
jgi:hypothetical protein